MAVTVHVDEVSVLLSEGGHRGVPLPFVAHNKLWLSGSEKLFFLWWLSSKKTTTLEDNHSWVQIVVVFFFADRLCATPLLLLHQDMPAQCTGR